MAAAPKRQARKPAAKRASPAVADAAPKPKGALGEHELGGLFAEALEAYDYQDERVRFDSVGRRWTFQPEKRQDHSTLALRVRRLEDEREDFISTAILASDLGKPMIEDVVRRLDEGLA